MSTKWTENKLQQYITDGIEETSELDYKAAGSLGRDTHQKIEITKDVSAMAHSAGGTVIYGIREFPKPKKHLPERIDPIDRTKFSKEWLEQIINLLQPRIDGIIIHPVTLSSGPNDVAYVVEVPQSTGVHQAFDHKYYKRFNFESVPMEHYEILDVMNRTTIPDASVRFDSKLSMSMGDRKQYIFLPLVKNSGKQIIKDFKLTFTFPTIASSPVSIHRPQPNINISTNKNNDYFIDYQSTGVLFQTEERNIGEEILWTYDVTAALIAEVRKREAEGSEIVIPWTLYADNMPSKHGALPLRTLNGF
jgi:hypothetical protein